MPGSEQRFRITHLICSVLALASSWLLASAWHMYSNWQFWHGIPMRDHIRLTIHDLVPWMFWTGIFCGLGWVVIGLPLALRGDRVFENPIRNVVVAGIGGVAIISLPLIWWSIPGWQFKGLLSVASLWFCGIAFGMAAVAMLLYEGYLALANRGRPVSKKLV